MTELDLAYIAGLIDGEGYIGITRVLATGGYGMKSPRYKARFQIRMVDKTIIEYLADCFGGKAHAYNSASAKGRPMFYFHASDVMLDRLLAQVMPYLRIKKPQVIAVQEFRLWQTKERSYRTKVVGSRQMTNPHGTLINIRTMAHSDEYIAECERFYLLCQGMNYSHVVTPIL